MATFTEQQALTRRISGDLTTLDQTLELDVTDLASQIASIATKSDVDASAVFQIEAEFIQGEWQFVGLFDGVAQEAADSVTGPSQYGWTDIPGALRVRVRRMDSAGGNGHVQLTVQGS